MKCCGKEAVFKAVSHFSGLELFKCEECERILKEMPKRSEIS